jgi:hypothetical protein
MLARCGAIAHSSSVEEAAAHRLRRVSPETIFHWRSSATPDGGDLIGFIPVRVALHRVTTARMALQSLTPEREAAAPPFMESTPGTLI